MSSPLRPPGAGVRPRARPLGDGARLRRDRSLIADAQRRYRVAAFQDQQQSVASAEGASGQTALTQQVRALYEGGVVPVRELAQLAGVSERTLYKYVQKHGWRRRYPGRGAEAGLANRGRPRSPHLRTPQGAGGRFIPHAQAGLPVRRGLKACDPEGEGRVLAMAQRADALAGAALARAVARQDAESEARVLSILARAMRELAAIGAEAKPRGQGRRKPRRRKEWRPMMVTPLPPMAAYREAHTVEEEPETELDRRLNAIAERFYARARVEGRDR